MAPPDKTIRRSFLKGMTIMEEKKYIDLDEQLAVIGLPEETIEVTIIAKVYKDGKLQDVEKVMSMQEVRKAFRLADENYFDPDERYVLTDAGRAFLEEMLEDERDSE